MNAVYAALMSMKVRKVGALITGAFDLVVAGEGVSDGLHVHLDTAGDYLTIAFVPRNGTSKTMKLREGYHPLEIKSVSAISASTGTFEASPLYG